jgi:hypothetical protein
MVNEKEQAAIQQFFRQQPEPEFFYVIDLTYSTGSTGDSSFHSLVSDPEACQAHIQRICAEQKARRDAMVAELNQLPEDERPYDPLIPDGCSVALCIVLPNRQQYVQMHSQQWYNNGQTNHSPLIPDIFDVAYYSDKVLHGEYYRSHVSTLV